MQAFTDPGLAASETTRRSSELVDVASGKPLTLAGAYELVDAVLLGDLSRRGPSRHITARSVDETLLASIVSRIKS